MERMEDPAFASTPRARATKQPAFKNGMAEMRSRVIAFNSHKNKPPGKMVLEAVLAIGVDSKGASLPAITKWILANYAVADSDRLKLQVKKIVIKFLDEGSLVRTKGSKGAVGVSGSFELPYDKPKKLSRTTKKNKEITDNDFNSETKDKKPKQVKKKKETSSVKESELDSSAVSMNTNIRDYFSSE